MTMGKPPLFSLGAWRLPDRTGGGNPLRLPAKHLVTHGVAVGMTGSGKTGLLMVLVEEALRCRIPTIVIDVKGDLPNLFLSLPSFAPEALVPWLEPSDADPASSLAIAAEQSRLRQTALGEAGFGEAELQQYCRDTRVRVLTPGSSAGELLHVLSPLEHRSPQWDTDVEAARQSLSATISLVLRLLGRDPDPARSRDHVLLSVLAERRLAAGQTAELPALLAEIADPPVAEIGALPVNSFLRKKERTALAASLNTLLASPTFASWRQGVPLDAAAWTKPEGSATPCTIVSVAHLDDDERALVLGVVLEEILSWVRGLRGSSMLRALIVFDEVYGYLPPYPANPPTKRPLVSLMKQARAFGVGVLVATQNPMDLDYRALSNAGLWMLGRLQTDADRERVLDGITSSEGAHAHGKQLGDILKRLNPRSFLVQNAHASAGPLLLRPRHTLSLMRGPLTRAELRAAREARAEWQR
jgi:hypothetical protein